MIKYIFVLYFFLAADVSYPQQFEWAAVDQINLSTNPGFLLHSITLDTSGNPIHARLIKSNQIYGFTYLGDFVVEKRDPSGMIIRNDTLTGNVHIKNLLTDKENNLIIYGAFQDTFWVDSTYHLINTSGILHTFILKFDANWNVSWLKDFTQIDPDFYRLNIISIDETNYLYAGIQTSSAISFIKKLDSDGNIISTITQTNVIDISGLSIDQDGFIWVTGATSSGNQSFNGFMANTPFPYNFYITRYSPGGVANWVKFVEDITFQSPKIECDQNGNAFLGGILHTTFVFDTITSQGPEWVYDFFLVKIDSMGNFIWLREVPVGNPIADATIGNGEFLYCSDDGSIFLSGLSRNNVDWGNGIISQSYGDRDVLVNKYSTNGELLWVKNAGSSWFDRVDGIVVDENNTCYITGMVSENAEFDSLSFAGGFVNSFIAKIKESNIVSVQTKSEKKPDKYLLHQNYPNPFNPTTTIEFDILYTDDVNLNIYNILGQEVTSLISKKLTPGNYKYKWNASEFVSGVYYYQLTTNNGIVQTRKLILMK